MREDLAQTNGDRLARLAIVSADHDAVCCEFVYRGTQVCCAIQVMEFQHLPHEELWRRYLAPALERLGVPAPVLPDPEREEQSVVVGVGVPAG